METLCKVCGGQHIGGACTERKNGPVLEEEGGKALFIKIIHQPNYRSEDISKWKGDWHYIALLEDEDGRQVRDKGIMKDGFDTEAEAVTTAKKAWGAGLTIVFEQGDLSRTMRVEDFKMMDESTLSDYIMQYGGGGREVVERLKDLQLFNNEQVEERDRDGNPLVVSYEMDVKGQRKKFTFACEHQGEKMHLAKTENV